MTKMPTVTATATVTQAVNLKPTVKRRLLTELKVYAELHAELKALELAMKKKKAAIEAVRAETGHTNIELEGFKIAYVQGQRTSLSKGRLLALGVSMSQIEDATETKPNKPYTKVTCPGAKDAD